MRDTFIQTLSSGKVVRWIRKNLIDIDSKESRLEEVLAAHDELLCLNDIGIFANNIHVVRQASAKAVTGAQTYPDILFLTDSGNVGVVEVKRYSNPELAGRKVVSQILDYGATISTLPEPDQVRLYRPPGSSAESFGVLVREIFPDCRSPDSLAERVRRQLKYGQIHYVIACDRVPDGLALWVRSISQSEATDFSVSVIEVSPYQKEGGGDDLIWFSAPRIQTETIQRTTIRFDVDSANKGVNVFLNSEITEEGNDILNGVSDINRLTNFDRFEAASRTLKESVGWGGEDLYALLKSIHEDLVHEDWSWVYEGFSDDGLEHKCFLRGKRSPGFVEGRFGLNWMKPWRPSFFAGYYFYGWDHGLEPSGEYGDFAIVLDVETKWGRETGFYDSKYFENMKSRLSTLDGWEFKETTNRYHPIMIRKPMPLAFSGISSKEALKDQWRELAREGLGHMLSGGELVRFKEAFED